MYDSEEQGWKFDEDLEMAADLANLELHEPAWEGPCAVLLMELMELSIEVVS